MLTTEKTRCLTSSLLTRVQEMWEGAGFVLLSQVGSPGSSASPHTWPLSSGVQSFSSKGLER